MGKGFITTLSICFFLGTGAPSALFSGSDGVCFRFYDQWKVAEKDKRDLQKKYGFVCLLFDKEGTVLIKGLSPRIKARFFNLYNQCMKDGCMFCDAGEGSCEEGTCGLNNASCKPYMENERPLCGEECGYYALRQL
jgi:hypothetical protein